MKGRRAFWFVLAAGIFAASSRVRAQIDIAHRAQTLIVGLDYEQARRELAAANAEEPSIAVERARLALYELDCDGAVSMLGRPELQHSEKGDELADVARGCQRVTAALESDRDEERGVEVYWQDEHDRTLAPLMFETTAKARDALTRDLGVDWPRPTRIVVVRDLLSLSAMTGLPYKSAQTTGTVAVAKWGRVTLLSPRASRHGYPWRDTLAHELTHLAVTRASGDRAPLWLQEGTAKREEVRWRSPGPFDDRPAADSVVAWGLEHGLAIPLDKLGPSIAMLPSADAATVAFAEVTSFLRFFTQAAGNESLPKVLAALKAGSDAEGALAGASGVGLKTWDAKWRAYIASRPRQPLAGPLGLSDEHGHEARIELRDRSRLGELLLARGHAAEARTELDHIAAAGPFLADPSIRWLRARALEGVGRREEGEPLVGEPNLVLSSYAPWWAIRGRWARLRGDEGMAVASFIEAVATDPFDIEAACESIDSSQLPLDVSKVPLCDSARDAGEPPFDDD